jgi:hypothetical protein
MKLSRYPATENRHGSSGYPTRQRRAAEGSVL